MNLVDAEVVDSSLAWILRMFPDACRLARDTRPADRFPLSDDPMSGNRKQPEDLARSVERYFLEAWALS